MGAVGQHQSAQAQADYQNESARRNYEYANRQRALDWQNQLSVWGVKRNEYQQQVGENFSAADRAYASEQTRLNEQYEAAALQKQDMMAQLIGLTGTNNASERSGRSVQRLDTAALAAFGRNNAIISKNLTSARSAMIQRVYDNNLQLDAANRRAYSNVAVAPTPGIAPPQPVMVAGPSGLGLASGLLGAAVSGFSTYNSLKAPKASNDPKGYNFNQGPTDSKFYGPAFGNDYVPYTPKNNYNSSFF